MREIKFRYIFKTVKTEKMFIDYFNIEEIERKLVIDWIQFKTDGLQEMIYIFERNEYTGLKDKNGKEIYEGDLLRVTEYDEKNPLVVGWEERTASFSINKKGWAFTHWFGESVEPEDCEIIGNIYENKELLEG